MAQTHRSHHATTDADPGPLWIALGLIVAFMAGEVVAGILAHSLALLSDAGHMLTDAGALGLSLVAIRLARQPPAGGFTYGLRRAEILSALANGATLAAIGALIVYEAVRRLIAPPPVQAPIILVVAIVGIVVNLLATWQIAKANRTSLNVEASFRHVLTDLYAFIGTAIAAIVILTTGFTRADAIISVFVALLMFHAAYGLLRDAGRVVLEGAPSGLSPDEVGFAIANHPGVRSVHDLHVWEITSGFPSLSAHVLVEEGADCHAIRGQLEGMLEHRFDLHHTTMQVDHALDHPHLIQVADLPSSYRNRTGNG
jgi:cobalt-zinc-cadmium efflux system protein